MLNCKKSLSSLLTFTALAGSTFAGGICWPKEISGERVVNELVGLIDLAPTFLEIAKITNGPEMTGKSLSGYLFAGKDKGAEPGRKYILTGRERHSHARADNLGYPARAIRTADYLFILNFKPDRWPAGDPAPENVKSGSQGVEKSLWPGYHDIDDSPTKLFLMEKSAQYLVPFKQGYEKRPAEELYQILEDPGCTHISPQIPHTWQ